MNYLMEMPEPEIRAIAERARARILEKHTPFHRAVELEEFLREL